MATQAPLCLLAPFSKIPREKESRGLLDEAKEQRGRDTRVSSSLEKKYPIPVPF